MTLDEFYDRYVDFHTHDAQTAAVEAARVNRAADGFRAMVVEINDQGKTYCFLAPEHLAEAAAQTFAMFLEALGRPAQQLTHRTTVVGDGRQN